MIVSQQEYLNSNSQLINFELNIDITEISAENPYSS